MPGSPSAASDPDEAGRGDEFAELLCEEGRRGDATADGTEGIATAPEDRAAVAVEGAAVAEVGRAAKVVWMRVPSGNSATYCGLTPGAGGGWRR